MVAVLVFSAANSYSLPYMIGKTVQSSKQQAPCYSLTGRSVVGAFCEDLAKVKIERNYRQMFEQFPMFLYTKQYLCLPTLVLGGILFLPGSSICPSQNRVCSVTWKPLKIPSWNFIEILTNIGWHAERKNHKSWICIFWVMFLWTL